jgi:hypothetical protein
MQTIREVLKARDDKFMVSRGKFGQLLQSMESDAETDLRSLAWDVGTYDSADFVVFGDSYRLRHRLGADGRTTIQLLSRPGHGLDQWKAAASVGMDGNWQITGRRPEEISLGVGDGGAILDILLTQALGPKPKKQPTAGPEF